jgi:hypothetical protein
MLINNNQLYAWSAPLAALPATKRGVKLSRELIDCFYVIEFIASKEPMPGNIYFPHLGRRAGTIRSRYFGRMEVIDPVLRYRIYEMAERLGMRRVAFLESELRACLDKGLVWDGRYLPLEHDCQHRLSW